MKFKAKNNVFLDTIKKARELIKEHDEHKHVKVQKKMPLKMLIGIRKKNQEREKLQKLENKQAQIFYDSSYKKTKKVIEERKKKSKKIKKLKF